MRKTPILSMAVILLFMLCPHLVWAGAKAPKATYVKVMYFNGTLIAMRLKQLNDDVLLSTTDPANHINAPKAEEAGIDVAVIDVKKELEMTINKHKTNIIKDGRKTYWFL